MLKHLDENEQRWEKVDNEAISCTKMEQSCDSSDRKITCASIEVRPTEASLPDTLHKKLSTALDPSIAECAVQDQSLNCCSSMPPGAESRRGSLPTCDTGPLIFTARRRNSAPVISHCTTVAVKKCLLATLAEHASSFCTRNSSSESEHLLPGSNSMWYAAETAGCKQMVDLFHSGTVKHCVIEPHHRAGSKKSARIADVPSNTDIEGRPRDRRSNSHALVFRQCFLAGRITGRRFSSPVVGLDHTRSRDCESVPLLSPIIPCSHSALVNWFVVLLLTYLVIISSKD